MSLDSVCSSIHSLVYYGIIILIFMYAYVHELTGSIDAIHSNGAFHNGSTASFHSEVSVSFASFTRAFAGRVSRYFFTKGLMELYHIMFLSG